MKSSVRPGESAREWETEELSLLFDVTRIFDKHADLSSALGPVLELLESRTGLSRGMVTLLDTSTGLLKIEEASGLSPDEKSRKSFRLGEGIPGRVFETGMPLAAPDRAGSCSCVPICSGKAVIGTLSAVRRTGRKDTEQRPGRDRALLEKLSSVISDSIKLRERIREERGGGGVSPGGEPLPDHEIVHAGRRIEPGSGIIGTGSAMRRVYETILQVAPSDATVLILGESGTGKELAAAELHRLSRRAEAPLIKVGCAALPESVIESELFGHEKGAFTGALSLRKGRFELAQGGTIFLDEIGEIPPQVQVKLLRVLQERELERVGGSTPIKVDVRIIAATNRNLEDEVKAGRFREDLYYRLNVFPIQIPPLRERKSDITLLADHFAEKYAQKNNKIIKRISTPAIDLLTSYSWPGNVRELENCMERAVILSTDMVIHSYHLPPTLQSAVSTNTEPAATLEAALSRLEKELIVEALKISGGNMAAAARSLGITERQMGLRVHHYGIRAKLYKR
ncbi:MAG: sigma 54-interacting transcriptional regulator [Treponema sp.]|nr:sigma 54-interacting transcriptional regulator [Treponema sp.]